MTQYVDVVPTLIEATGGDPKSIDTGRPDTHGNKGFDGRSFLRVLLGEADKHHDYVYGVQTTRGIINGSACYPIRSVRSERYKYIWNLNYQAVFYNVVSTNPNNLLQTWKKMGQNDPAVAARARFYQHRPAEELYDLEEDPFELKNLAGDPACAKIKSQLKRQLDFWMQQQADLGVTTELRATQRQGPNKKWTPYNPARPRVRKQTKENADSNKGKQV